MGLVLLPAQATSALDAESEAAVQEALDRAMRTAGRSVLVIAHRHAPQFVTQKRMRLRQLGSLWTQGSPVKTAAQGSICFDGHLDIFAKAPGS